MHAHDTGSLSEHIAQHIAEQIIHGDLVEGERIQELRIAQELDVSRGSVREALLLLQRTHLIEIYPRRGAVVAELSLDKVRALMSTMQWVLDYLMQQLPLYWQASNGLLWQQVLLKLQQQASSRHTDQFYDVVFLFLGQQYALIQNPYLQQFYQELLPSLRRCYFLTLNTPRGELKEALSKFEGITAAVLAQNHPQSALFMADFCRHLQALVLDSLTRMKQIELAWSKRSRR